MTMLPSPHNAAIKWLERLHSPTLGRITSLADPRANPLDGLVVATGTRTASPLGPSTSRVCIVEDGVATELTIWTANTRLPRWSPDGRTLAFTTDRRQGGIHQLALADRDRLHDPEDGPVVPGTIEHLSWSPNGSRLLAVVAGHGAEQAGAMASGRIPLRAEDVLPAGAPIVRRFDRGGPENEWRRLWIATSGVEVAICATPSGPCVWEAAWLGDDAVVAIVSDRPEEDAWYGARCSVLDVHDGAERVMITSERQLGVPAGSPDGRWVACIEAPCSDRTLVAGRVVVGDTTTGDVTRHNLGLDATHLVWLDESRLLVSGLVGMATRVVELRPLDGATHERWSTTDTVGPRQPETWPTPSGGLVAAADSWDEGPLLLQVDVDGIETTSWSGLTPEMAALRDEIGSVEVRTWTALDGLQIEGLLLRPAGDGPHPTVLYAHGGPVAMWRPRLLMGYAAVALLVTRGYAVFMPNPRGSSGYGWDFADAVHGDMGGLDTHDLLAGIDALVAEGVADADRLAVMGGSYAGYMTCWLVTQTDRFKAAVASAPVTNWISQHFQSNIPQWGVRFLPDASAFPGGGYVDRSPVFFAHRVTTPTMLITGAHDRCCATSQALEFHEALRLQGIASELVVYPDEAHNVPTGENLIDDIVRTVSWIERWCPLDESASGG